MEERIYDYWAATLQDGYIGSLIDIVERAGGAKELYCIADDKISSHLGVSKKMATHIIRKRTGIDIERDYEAMCKAGINYVNYKDDNYPCRLLNIASRPYGLFVKGKLPNEDIPSVAIVGARECSEYGRLMAEYFGDRLSRKGINIISGMAWGIDGIAQMAAVKAEGKSYAVLGCGIDVIYPRNNARLYEMLCDNGNGVISEYAPGTRALSRLFPPRNRIISGLSDIVLVVEARAKSGTLITVNMAIEQGKTVMVVPGRITDALSAGCLSLIGDGAIPVTSVESIVNELDTKFSVNREKGKYPEALAKEHVMLKDDEKMVYDVLSLDPTSVESIGLKLGWDISRVLVTLSALELKDCVKETSNDYFVKKMVIESVC